MFISEYSDGFLKFAELVLTNCILAGSIVAIQLMYACVCIHKIQASQDVKLMINELNLNQKQQ